MHREFFISKQICVCACATKTELPAGGTLDNDRHTEALSAMDSLRDTLRDEHTCLLQAKPPPPPPSRYV